MGYHVRSLSKYFGWYNVCHLLPLLLILLLVQLPVAVTLLVVFGIGGRAGAVAHWSLQVGVTV